MYIGGGDGHTLGVTGKINQNILRVSTWTDNNSVMGLGIPLLKKAHPT